MDAFFGQQQRGPRGRVRRGADALVAVEVDLAEAAFGGERELTLETAVHCGTCGGEGTRPGTSVATCGTCAGRGEVQSVQRTFLGQVMTARPCPTCGGAGEVVPDPCDECGGDGRVRQRRTLTVKIPAGVENGMRIRLTGQGEVGPGGGPAGDLYVEVHETPDPDLQRDGEDLHATLPLPFTAAALGACVPLRTLEGTEEVDVPPGTQPGQVLTLRARGVPRLRGTGRGDLLVHVDVQTPQDLDGEQEKLLRELARLRDEEHPGSKGRHEGLFGRFRRR